MSSELAKAASEYAQRAAADLVARRQGACVGSAGVAIELLLKAYLEQLSPILIVGSKQGRLNGPALRWAVDRKGRFPRDGRTIDASEAASRVSALVPEISENSLRPALAARNGALHAGHVAEDEVDQIIASVAATAAVLLPALSLTTEEFWGQYADAVAGRLDQQRSAVANLVSDRMATSRRRLEDLQALGKEVLALLVTQARAGASPSDEPFECPVCGTVGIVEGDVQVEEAAEYDHDGLDYYLSHVALVPWFTAESFECRLCQLRLDDAEQFIAAGVEETTWQSAVDIDEREYWGEYDDDDRGR